MKDHLPAMKSLAGALMGGVALTLLSQWLVGKQATEIVGPTIALGLPAASAFASSMNNVLSNLASSSLDRSNFEKSLAKSCNDDLSLLRAQASAVATLAVTWCNQNANFEAKKVAKRMEEFWIKSIQESHSSNQAEINENIKTQLSVQDDNQTSLDQWLHVIRAAFTKSDDNFHTCLLSQDDIISLASYCDSGINKQLLIELSKPRHQGAKDQLSVLILLEINRRLMEQGDRLVDLLQNKGPSLYLPEPREGNGFHYLNESVSFTGRINELKLIKEFITDDEFLAQWMRLTGPAGSGKSRLALHLCRLLKLLGWDAGFLKWEVANIADQWNSWQPQRDTFVVIDYALDHVNEVKRLLAVIAKNDYSGAHKIRLLLIARHHKDGRWDRIFPPARTSTSEILERRLYPRPRKFSTPGECSSSHSLMTFSFGSIVHPLDESTACRLGQMDRQELLAIAEQIWEKRGVHYSQFEHLRSQYEKWMEDVGSQEGIGHQLPLYAQFAAALTLERIQGENFSNEKFSIELLSGFILDRELQGWRDISANSNQILEYHADLIFLACILGGINCFEDSLGNYLDLPVPHFSDLQAKLSLSRGFNLTDGYVPPIEPDALAELYVLYRLLVPRELYLFGSDSKARTLKLFKTALAATPETKEKVLNFLSRATDSFPKLVSDSGLLAFLNDPEMLTLTASRLTSHSVSSQDVEETLRVGDRLWRETRQEVARRDWMLAIAARICKERKTDVTWQFCTSKSYPSDFLGFCLLERGSAFIEDGDEETAWQDMNAVANLPDIPKQILGIACYNLGFLENKFGNYVQAAKYYNLVREHCQNSHEAYAKATVNLSALQERVGDAETAIGLLSEIVAMEGTPHEQQSLARAGVITWTARTGQYDRSLSLIDSWDDLLEDQDAEVRFQVRNSKGYCLMMKGQYDSAIKIFEGALSDHAPSIYAVHQAWINLAYCKENLGFDDDALVILERVRTDPTCNDETKAKSWQNSGHCWLKKQVLSIAISDFRTAAKWSLLFPEVDYGVKLGLLQCYLSAELIVESEQAFAKLQELPNLNSRQEAEVLMHSALLEEIRGDWHKREVAISKAFEKNPMEVIRLAQQWDWTEELEKFGGGGEN